MANPPPLLNGPAQATTALYREFFADARNDPFSGNYAEALRPYAINANNTMTPAQVSTLAVNCRNQNVPTAFLLLHQDDSKIHIYLQLDRLDPRFGFPASPFDDRLFVGKGELHHGNHQIVEWQLEYFHQTGNIQVPTSQAIDTALAHDNNVNLLLGPFNAGAADINTIRTRNTCYVPPVYVPLFLAEPLTPRQAWETVQAQIVTDNRVEACQPLIDFLRCCITISNVGNEPLVANLPPYVPMATPYLLDRRRAIIERDFPFLSQNAAVLQQTAIAGQLGLLVDETRAGRIAETERKAAERNKTPDVFLGPAGLTRLLRYCQVGNMALLPQFWASVSRTPKSQQLSILQWEINRVKLELNEPDLPFVVSASLWEAIKSLQWEMTTNDAVNTGVNPFLLGDHDVTQALNQQSIYEMLHGDGASPSLNDAAALMKSKAGAPKLIFNARQQIRRFEILNRIILGNAHPLCNALNIMSNRMISSEHMLHQRHQQHLLLPTLICKKVAVQASNWYKNQACTPTPHPAPILHQLFLDIEEDNHWIPSTPASFLQLLGLSYFSTPSYTPITPITINPSSLPPSLPSPTSTTPITNNNNTPTTSPNNTTNNSTRTQQQQQQRVVNTTFNLDLFNAYREAPVTCRAVRQRIANNELPALPLSKIDGQAMCLALHAKGTCNNACGRKADHVSYTKEEYAPLAAWCQEHFPTS